MNLKNCPQKLGSNYKIVFLDTIGLFWINCQWKKQTKKMYTNKTFEKNRKNGINVLLFCFIHIFTVFKSTIYVTNVDMVVDY